MREIRLLTETSTQIRISAEPKASPSALPEVELRIITGTLYFGKCFCHSALDALPSRLLQVRESGLDITSFPFWYDGK